MEVQEVETSFISNGPPAERQRAAHNVHVADVCRKNKTITILVVFIILVVIIVILSILLGTQTGLGKAPEEPVCSCAPGWKAYEQKCYYFSEVEKNWTLSQSFCASQDASLAVLESKDEVDFLMFLKGKHSIWIHEKNSMLDVSGNGGYCACLNDEPKPIYLRCSNEHHFICTKTMKLAGAVPGVNRVE